jgi:glycine/D-amino acid oxidase-like deaminating enzyme
LQQIFLKIFMNYFQSFWERDILLRPFDFIILGAGLIGKQIAIQLKTNHPNARIALVDEYPLSYGASTRNAGFACFGSVAEIMDDCKRSKTEDVAALAKKRYTGINLLVKNYGADAIGYQNTGSFELFTSQQEADELQEQAATVNQILKDHAGIENAFSLKNIEHLGMKYHKDCLFNPFEGMLHTGKLNEVINRKTHQMDVQPLYGLKIEQIEQITGAYVLHAENGMKLSCSQLIVANNAFASQLLPELDVVPARGQIVLTQPIEGLKLKGIYHSDKGYIYFRNLGDRILIGGARNQFFDEESTYEFSGSEQLKNHLINYIQENILPEHTFEVDMHWSGIMAMGTEKIPIVKRINDNLVVCVRMSGMGVALGPVLSQEVAAFYN